MQPVHRIFALPSVDRRGSSFTEPYKSGGSTATSRDAAVVSLDCSNDLHACGPCVASSHSSRPTEEARAADSSGLSPAVRSRGLGQDRARLGRPRVRSASDRPTKTRRPDRMQSQGTENVRSDHRHSQIMLHRWPTAVKYSEKTFPCLTQTGDGFSEYLNVARKLSLRHFLCLSVVRMTIA